MGRPALHGQTKSKRFEIRLNPEHCIMLEWLSESMGLSKAEVVIVALRTLTKREKRKQKNCAKMPDNSKTE